MSFSFTTNVPQPTDDPSVSQGQFLTNFNSINGIADVDHIGYNLSNGGRHKQIFMPTYGTPGAPTGQAGTIYTAAGTADNTKASPFFKNGNGTFLLNPVKAWAACTTPGGSSGAVTIVNGQNVASGSYAIAGTVSMVLTANAVKSVNYAVLVSANGTFNHLVINNYNITGVNTFNLVFFDFSSAVAVTPTSFSIAILQI